MIKHFTLLIILASIIIYSCGTGRNFTVTTDSELSLGTTTISDIENKFGKPEDLKTIEENNLSSIYIHTFIYKNLVILIIQQ